MFSCLLFTVLFTIISLISSTISKLHMGLVLFLDKIRSHEFMGGYPFFYFYCAGMLTDRRAGRQRQPKTEEDGQSETGRQNERETNRRTLGKGYRDRQTNVDRQMGREKQRRPDRVSLFSFVMTWPVPMADCKNLMCLFVGLPICVNLPYIISGMHSLNQANAVTKRNNLNTQELKHTSVEICCCRCCCCCLLFSSSKLP